MFKRILVPLDGSLLAEQAISLATHLAHTTGGSVLFLLVVDPSNMQEAYSLGAADLHLDTLKHHTRAAAYLARIAKSAEFANIDVYTAVLSGQPALQILNITQQQNINLIVLCSHGYTGFQRWTLGSVAQKVACSSEVPVLILREKADRLFSKQAQADPIRVMIALDGSHLAERALEPAIELSASLSAPGPGALHLVQVLPFSTAFEYDQEEALPSVCRVCRQDAQIYLGQIREQLLEKNAGISITTSLASSQDIAEALINIAERGIGEGMSESTSTSDVIALATHGQGGPSRWEMGRVAERILGATRLPLLIVRSHRPSTLSA